MFLVCFFELNLLDIEITNDTKCLGKEPLNLECLEMKNKGKKSRTPRYKGWGVAPPIAPKDNFCP